MYSGVINAEHTPWPWLTDCLCSPPPPVLNRQYPDISAISAFLSPTFFFCLFFFTGLGQGVAEIIASHVKVGLSVFVCPRLCASVLEGRMCGWW